MKNMLKGKKINLFILVLFFLVFFLMAGPAITHGEGTGQVGDGLNSPPSYNSEETVNSFDSLLLFMTLSMLV